MRFNTVLVEAVSFSFFFPLPTAALHSFFSQDPSIESFEGYPHASIVQSHWLRTFLIIIPHRIASNSTREREKKKSNFNYLKEETCAAGTQQKLPRNHPKNQHTQPLNLERAVRPGLAGGGVWLRLKQLQLSNALMRAALIEISRKRELLPHLPLPLLSSSCYSYGSICPVWPFSLSFSQKPPSEQ